MTVSLFARYALPSDDLVFRLQPTITASAEDTAYPATNWYEVRPSKPAKLTTNTGDWVFDFAVPVNVAAFAAMYHNFDPGSHVTLQWNSVDSWAVPVGEVSITIPEWWEDEWSVSPFVEVPGSPTYQFWRLVVEGSPENSSPLSLGRPLFVGALRELDSDLRWGAREDGGYKHIQHTTIGDADRVMEFTGPRRTVTGDLSLYDTTAADLLTLYRSARNNSRPWLLIKDITVNDAMIGRFEQDAWSRTYDNPNNNLFPFVFRELSRGLPWR